MSVMIPRGATFLGVPLVKVRDVLRAWRHGESRDAHKISRRKNILLDPRTVIVLLEELRDRGFIGAEDDGFGESFDGLTEKGLSLVLADARKPTPKDRARQLVDRLLSAAAVVNAREELPFYVGEIWLFGSMLDADKKDVGDIDLVVLTHRKEDWDFHFAMTRYDELALALGASEDLVNTPGVMGLLKAEGFVKNQTLYGGRRHPLLSLNGISELQHLACPCQLIFDSKRGGVVNDPVLPKHPDSTGRSDKIRDALAMPDLLEGRQALHPLPADLTRPGYFHRSTAEAVGPWPPSERAWYSIVMDASMEVLTEGAKLPKDMKANVVTKRLDLSVCDPRYQVGLIISDHKYPDPDRRYHSIPVPRYGVIVSRSVEEDNSRVILRIHIEDVARSRNSSDYSDVYPAEWWVFMLMGADVERILRRDAEDGLDRAITVRVTARPGRPDTRHIAARLRLDARHLVAKTRARLTGA